MRIRFESAEDGRTLTAAVRRESDNAYWDFDAGAWSASLDETPLTESDSGAGTSLYSATADIEDDGLYAVLVREAGATVAIRYASVIDGTDGAPATPAERSSDAADVLLAVRRRLVEAGAFTDSQADIALADDEPYPVEGAVFAHVCPLDVPGGPMVEGGGRHVTDARLPFVVRIVVRKAGDRVHLARRALAYPGGLLRRVRATVDALQQFIPLDAAACALVTEPVRLANCARPVRYSSDALWYRAELQYDTAHRVRFGDEDLTF